jgi:hypothetical protein
MTDKRLKQDMEKLLGLAEFKRFLFFVIQNGRILDATTDGSDSRHLGNEGRRQLALEILARAALGQPAEHSSYPILTLIQVLREEAQQQPEKPVDARYDRTAELDEPDGDDPPD